MPLNKFLIKVIKKSETDRIERAPGREDTMTGRTVRIDIEQGVGTFIHEWETNGNAGETVSDDTKASRELIPDRINET